MNVLIFIRKMKYGFVGKVENSKDRTIKCSLVLGKVFVLYNQNMSQCYEILFINRNRDYGQVF